MLSATLVALSLCGDVHLPANGGPGARRAAESARRPGPRDAGRIADANPAIGRIFARPPVAGIALSELVPGDPL